MECRLNKTTKRHTNMRYTIKELIQELTDQSEDLPNGMDSLVTISIDGTCSSLTAVDQSYDGEILLSNDEG
jgi:hypothetical protein